MANVGTKGIIKYTENWATDPISTAAGNAIGWLNSSDTSDTAFARAVAAGKGLHVSGALYATDNNMIELCHDSVHIFGQEGYAAMEVLFQVSTVASLAINVGFNDTALEAVGNTLPIELDTVTWTTNTSTAALLVYDTDATNDEWHCMWVNDDTDATDAIATLRMNGIAPVASKWIKARVELQDRGSGNGLHATFSISSDGKSCTKEYNTSIDRDCGLVPYIAFENRAALAHTVYIKYITIEQSIAD